MSPLLLSLLIAQTSVGPGGIRSNGVTIDAGGIHAGAPGGVGTVFNGNRVVRSVAGRGRSFTVNGNGNRITITGSVSRVTVNGNRNVVRLTGVGELVVAGNGNRVVWSHGLMSRRPSVTDVGSGNRVARQ